MFTVIHKKHLEDVIGCSRDLSTKCEHGITRLDISTQNVFCFLTFCAYIFIRYLLYIYYIFILYMYYILLLLSINFIKEDINNETDIRITNPFWNDVQMKCVLNNY